MPTMTKAEWKDRLVRRVMGMVAVSDADEEKRRASDRIGAYLYYGKHWNRPMPDSRSAITANVTKALIDHKIAIMTKQDPIPVVEPTDAGDADAARLMRPVLQRWWESDGMRLKVRQLLRLDNTTRTCAGKAVWDPSLREGAGDVTVDVIPGWRLILDPRTRNPREMEFAGDRAIMPRTRAMRLYPDAAKEIREAHEVGTKAPGGGNPSSPAGSPWKRAGAGVAFETGSAVINGKPVLTAFAGNISAPSLGESDVEIIELYYRDRSVYTAVEEDKDDLGNVRKRVARHPESGMPLFREVPGSMVATTGPDGQPVHFMMPGFELEMQPVMKEVVKPKYPFWRRTTVLMPEGVMLEDKAWDAPLPYAVFNDNEPLDGVWAKGCALDLEHLQAALNVSLSNMMDMLRLNAWRPIVAAQGANIQDNSTVINPGQVIRVQGASPRESIWPLEFPAVNDAWFGWCNFVISLMEKIVGATGIMQGEAAGRVDSAAGYDTLAEIGGSRLVESTQRMEQSIADLMQIVGWYVQHFYTERHAVKIEESEGNATWERAYSPFLKGSFSYKVATGSTLAWSESAVRARLLQEMQQGLLDKVGYWKRTNYPDWQEIAKRLAHESPALAGMAGAPPPRTRSAPKHATKPQRPNVR